MRSRIRAGSVARLAAHVVVLLLVAVSALVAAPLEAATGAGYATPTGLATASRATTSLSLAWAPSSGAPRYRIQYSTSPTMADAVYRRSYSTRFDLTGLSPDTTYYLKVRVISADGTKSLTPYSTAHAIATQRADSTLTTLNPTDFAGRAASSSSLAVTWSSRGTGVYYRVQYSRSSSMADPVYKRFTTIGGTLGGLTAATPYYLRVTVTDTRWNRLSEYTPAIRVATTAVALSTVKAPTGLSAESRARNALGISWTPIQSAARYRVRYSTSSTMSNASYAYTTTPRADLTGLSSSRDYHVQVRALRADGSDLTSYSSTLRATTRSSGSYSVLNPAGFTVGPEPTMPAEALGFSWQTRGSAYNYRVRASKKSDMSSAQYLRVTDVAGALAGLTPGTVRYVQVAVASSSWATISDYTPARKATTLKADVPAPTGPHPLRVASYNVACYLCGSDTGYERPWYERKASVAKVIRDAKADVIGIQEASQGAVKDPDTGVSTPQFLQLRDAVGSTFRLTNEYRYNCERSTSANNCTHVDRGASQGTRILYNHQRVRLLAQGSRRLTEINASDNDRYVAWATFEQLSSGKRFFFADTHLEGQDDPSGSAVMPYHELRRTQAQEVLATIRARNTANLPVVLVGDLNSSRWSNPSNVPYDVFLAGGLVDHLGAAYKTTHSQPGADVEHRVRNSYSTFNDYKPIAPRNSYVNGTMIDYVLTSPMRMTEHENVVSVDPATGGFVPVIEGSSVLIPSDHNLLRATVHLP